MFGSIYDQYIYIYIYIEIFIYIYINIYIYILYIYICIYMYFNKDSGDAVFSFNRMGILNIDLDNINLDKNFDEDDTIILIRILVWHIKF